MVRVFVAGVKSCRFLGQGVACRNGLSVGHREKVLHGLQLVLVLFAVQHVAELLERG